jgi:hypothetical protein
LEVRLQYVVLEDPVPPDEVGKGVDRERDAALIAPLEDNEETENAVADVTASTTSPEAPMQ